MENQAAAAAAALIYPCLAAPVTRNGNKLRLNDMMT
jgi:hypothetical protein